MNMQTLPVLNMQDPAEKFQADLKWAGREVGFFYLTGHGIPQSLIQSVLDMGERFFSLSQDEKEKISMLKSPHFRGYTAVGGELTLGKTDWREQIDFATDDSVAGHTGHNILRGPNLYPDIPDFQRIVEQYIHDLSQLSLRLLESWASALGVDGVEYASHFIGGHPHLKIAKYVSRAEEQDKQGVGAHKDMGVLTLLYVEDGKRGLQVEHNGEWIDAPSVPGAFVVNIGELMEVATNGALKATLHRVQSPPPGESRMSLPFFYGPPLEATVPAIEVEDAPGVTVDPDNPLYPIYGDNWLKSRIRSHPAVVDKYYSIWT